MRRSVITAILVLLAGTVLGGTLFRAPIGHTAEAASSVLNVFVTNDSTHPVPVREQNLDASGNIKVHEQGTANVNVTNSSLAVASPAPITGGGGAGQAAAGGSPFSVVPTAVATALIIHMNSEVNSTALQLNGALVDNFLGPGGGGNADIVLALTRPIEFDQIICFGVSGGLCGVSWIGNSP
jgi:hypothetical protein